MAFHDEYLDVLQNIEFGIVQVYKDHPELHDYEVMSSIEALINHYVAQLRNSESRHFSLSERSKLVYENVKMFCEYRLGRESIPFEDEENDDINLKLYNIDEIVTCLKKILNSVKKWNKRGGRQAYLDFVSQFIK